MLFVQIYQNGGDNELPRILQLLIQGSIESILLFIKKCFIKLSTNILILNSFLKTRKNRWKQKNIVWYSDFLGVL